jgi:WD40 repeat protein
MTTDEYIASIDIGAYREYDTIMAAAFSPDGQQIATTSHGVQLWNAANGELEQMLLDQSSNISFGIKYTQDGRFLAAGDSGTIWDVESGDVLVQPSIEPAWHSALTFSEAGDWYALPSKDGNVYVWRLSDLLNGEAANPDTALATLRVMTPYRSDGWIYAQFVYTAASPDGRLLAAIYAGDLFLFDMETFTLVHQIPERGHLLRFSPDGRLLLVGNGYCYCGAADESAQVGHARLWGVPSTEE